MGGRREVSIIFYRPVTRSDLKQETSFFRGSVSSFLQLVVAWSENKSSERLEQLGYGDTCRILNYYERLSEISESVKDVSVQSIYHLLSALIKVTRPSFFGGG